MAQRRSSASTGPTSTCWASAARAVRPHDARRKSKRQSGPAPRARSCDRLSPVEPRRRARHLDQQAYPKIDGVIANPAAYTHTSIAIADALRILKCPIIELHFNSSYRYADRKFRQFSHVRPVATGVIFGFGAAGWLAAIEAMKLLLDPPFEAKKQ
jgi:hypothetical protein